MTEDQAEQLGQLADRLDAVLYSAKMPGLPPQIHIEGLTGTIRDVRDELATIVREVTGEDPWATNPLAG